MTTTDQPHEGDVLKTDVLGRVRVKREHREQILDDFECSGMSGRAYAKLHGIHHQTFASWIQKRRRARGDYDNEEIRTKLRMGNQSAKAKSASPGRPKKKKPEESTTALSLIEIAMPQESEPAPHHSNRDALEVELPGGVKVHFASKSQLGLLKALIKEVGSC